MIWEPIQERTKLTRKQNRMVKKKYIGLTLEDRFWKGVPNRPEDGCWTWDGPTDDYGYGRFKHNNKNYRSHRISYEIHYGPLNDLCVLHKCDNPSCVNPSHLWAGDRIENNADRHAKGRSARRHPCRRGEKHHRCKITADAARYVFTSNKPSGILAKELGIDGSSIRSIRRRRSWAHETKDLEFVPPLDWKQWIKENDTLDKSYAARGQPQSSR